MGIKTTRKILSIIITIVIAVATTCMIASSVLGATFASHSFFEKHLITNEIVEECNNQLNLRYDALESESGIPARVFEMVTQDYSTEENLKLAVSYIFGDESSNLYSKERVGYFYNLCEEYVKGNDISYNKKELMAVADKAAVIYSETVGIHNTDAIRDYLSVFAKDCAKSSSISIVAIILCIGLLVILYSKKNEPVSYFAGGLAGGGFATVLGAIIALIIKLGTKLSVTPQVYQNSMSSMVRIYFGYLVLAGLAVCLIGSLINFFIGKYIKREEDRQATRFNKIVAKL